MDGSCCRKYPMTHDQAQTALRNLYVRNNGGKKRKRGHSKKFKKKCLEIRETRRGGEMQVYFCNDCSAWHVGHWRPRERAGGRYLPDEGHENGSDLLYVINLGNDTFYRSDYKYGVSWQDAERFAMKDARDSLSYLKCVIPGLPAFIEAATDD